MRRWVLLAMFILPTSLLAANLPSFADLPARPELPDPLVMLNGEKITTADEWTTKRRPELKQLFQHYMYGYLPKPLPIRTTVTHTDPKALNGKATLKLIDIAYGPEATPPIHLLLVVPNERKGPVPAFVGMNFSGNHAILSDPKIPLPTVWLYPNRKGVVNNRATDEGRGTDIDTWALEQSIDRGYAIATFYSGDVDPDHKESRDGVQKHILAKSEVPPKHEAATIAIWAYGIHRVIDYMITNADIDAKRIAVVGHSRLGKTTLLAAALDERIALAIPLQAGCGGTAPSRGKIGEPVERINTAFPHWFNDAFKEFNKQPEKLPFDQHCLVAICAPRPVLFANAVEDTWANPVGQLEVLKAAEPVYKLLKAGGCDAEKMPEVGKLVASKLGYYIRDGKHSMTKGDWKIFLDYADAQMKN